MTKRDVRGIVVGSRNAAVGFPYAIEVLRRGGTALEAAIAAVKAVEDDLRDQGVGTGGIPNILGEVELDASVMDGRTLAAGAVGALKHYPHPIEVARRIMECTPHVMLVGDGAELFARTHGFQPANLLTPEAEAIWRAVIRGERSTEQNVYEDHYQLYMSVVRRWRQLLHRELFGTTNVIVRDLAGNIASAVSTSGWGFKWPGRLGDSPIIGAGNYADNRFGAAACTGRGEMAIRCATAHSVVMYLRFGFTLEDALRQAMLDLRALDDPYAEADTVMNIVAMDRDGNVAAASTSPEATYVVQTIDMETYEERPRLHVPLRE
ncbi:N(4)-(beta-N-acetylglucosaminyl)-L-asparaginase [Thermomicrobium sp. 4228-Ro]|uniref:N(4)-(beta-N-acetylglucosaminyl)-L-asparaginase n=1 Tax=Thermomicrobium sp. 4228-Ro TaxID=2993937 RepID=UPI0022493A1D|nr:N(4)-(beta-N-acetylglucosaminyl)-L-asparaginase [Thermomicrobium sp. 4228-Ro]MCX2728469.1 N(4)-(beta-N-acetylglucosaminyl)-L-asparaginase [Thermomicrobium sp. 4228-Ro]